MTKTSRVVLAVVWIAAFLSSAMPCGPGYVTPLFDTTSAPESPYSDFAAGRLGLIKPTFTRSVLFAAYRYIAGNGLTGPEQQAMIDVWKAELDNKDFRDDSVDEAVKAWIAGRKKIIGKEENTLDIYTERDYGSYDFFPNCAKNAFETALDTLNDRASAHGPSDPNVRNWIEGQDDVFENCAKGKQTPEPAPPGAPDWLQKDRAYQIAAAAFYSLDYKDAKTRFAEIAQDMESPWQETADYLVARTLIRQASTTKSPEAQANYYDEAEAHLQRFVSSGKFADSAEKMMGLIKYRHHPRERVTELAKKLTYFGGNENFRQDVIDYNWLLDKFENEILTEEEARKAAEKPKDAIANNTATNSAVTSTTVNTNTGRTVSVRKNDDDLELNLWTPTYDQSWVIFVPGDATDEQALAEAERIIGKPLNDEMKKRVREARQSAYAARYSNVRQPSYEGGYYGNEKLTPSLVPDFLRQDDLTDWLYSFQMKDPSSYLYALKRYRETNSQIWLMTALSKAENSSADLSRLIDAAQMTSRSSPAYTTIAYHTARILLNQGKTADARKLIDEMLDSSDLLTTSARNAFLGMRVTLTETLEDFLKYSLKKPYAFDFDGEVGTIEEIIAEQKKWYDPETNKDGREAYDAEVEDRYKQEKLWQSRPMFDSELIDVFNKHFPTKSLVEVMHSPALPDYMRERFAVAIWTRAYLLDDIPTLLAVTPELAGYHPEMEPLLARVKAAKTQVARDEAVLYFMIKNPLLSPFVEEATGKSDNEVGPWDSNDWWCQPYDSVYNDETGEEGPAPLPPRPKFLTPAQSAAAQAERKKLKGIGDAPAFLAARVMEMAKRNPADRRLPEMLYTMVGANGWTKYGCGNNEETHDALLNYLKKHYPSSEWTAKAIADESDK